MTKSRGSKRWGRTSSERLKEMESNPVSGQNKIRYAKPVDVGSDKAAFLESVTFTQEELESIGFGKISESPIAGVFKFYDKPTNVDELVAWIESKYFYATTSSDRDTFKASTRNLIEDLIKLGFNVEKESGLLIQAIDKMIADDENAVDPLVIDIMQIWEQLPWAPGEEAANEAEKKDVETTVANIQPVIVEKPSAVDAIVAAGAGVFVNIFNRVKAVFKVEEKEERSHEQHEQ